MPTFQTLGQPGNFYECPRWHADRWWLSDFYGRVVRTVTPDGTMETVLDVPGQPGGLGWLPDGSLLIVAMRDRRILRLRDGRVETYADLSEVFPGFANDMTVSSNGNAYVGNFGFDLEDPTAATSATVLAMVDQSGSVRIVASGLRFPNASAITPDGRTLIVNETLAARHRAFTIDADGTLSEPRVWAQVAPAPKDPDAAFADLTYAPDGGCLDAGGRMWAADVLNQRVVLVAEGGAVVTELAIPGGLSAFACGLGGTEGRTLLVTAAPDFNPSKRSMATESVLLTTEVDVPRIGLAD